jgi:hypothetical protein
MRHSKDHENQLRNTNEHRRQKYLNINRKPPTFFTGIVLDITCRIGGMNWGQISYKLIVKESFFEPWPKFGFWVVQGNLSSIHHPGTK